MNKKMVFKLKGSSKMSHEIPTLEGQRWASLSSFRHLNVDDYVTEIPEANESSVVENDYGLSPTDKKFLSNLDSNHKHVYQFQTPNAIDVNSVSFKHSKSSNDGPAVNNVTLSVRAGEIYGLLGPSGCGKTTLLRCIVHQLKPSSGSIRIFGHQLGSEASQIPGPGIGFMPQEIALFPDFTIKESLFFFGRLYGMERETIRERIRFLLKFLDLPHESRLICSLSGGQKRRVSLAVSLIHKPPILILDEPTVGVDPLLRQAIWSHLINLTKTDNLTIIITTHYIEEARQANTCGLMRAGRLLIQASPDYLLSNYQHDTLEDVFLYLCQLDANNEAQKIEDQKINCIEKVLDETQISGIEPVEETFRTYQLSGDDKDISEFLVHVEEPNNNPPLEREPIKVKKYRRTAALIGKNLTRLLRNLPILLFQFLLPSIEIILFFICIGHDPFDLNVSIYNGEINRDYSVKFFNTLDNKTIIKNYVNSETEALDAVRRGESWAAIVINDNFTESLQARFVDTDIDSQTLISSQIRFYLDMTNQVINLKLQKTIYETFEKFASDLLIDSDQNPELVRLPIKIENPIYGSRDMSFTEFMAPGILLSIAFLMAVALTAMAFVMERKEGLLERSLVAGVTSSEFVISHVVVQLMVLSVQAIFLIFFTFYVFNIHCNGPFIVVVILTLLQACCGMCYGLMISSFCYQESTATLLALGSFYPILLLSGTVWPLQAVPYYMRYFAYMMPQTLPIEAMRYVLGHDFSSSLNHILIAVGVSFGWIIFFLAAAVIIFKRLKF